MSVLLRPRVTARQVVETTSPTALTPSLVPCVIGPSYQIVDLYTIGGAINPDAALLAAAMMVADDDVGDLVDVSGKSIEVSIGGTTQVVTFPTSVGGAPYSRNVVTATINREVSGMSAQWADNRLVLRTVTKGDAARFSLLPASAPGLTPAYDDLGIDPVTQLKEYRGFSKYENRTSVVSFRDLPLTKVSSVDLLQIAASDLNVYRLYNRTAYRLSQSSAVMLNPFTGGATKIGGLAVDRGMQPAFNYNTSTLRGLAIAGSATTDRLLHTGRSASVVVPLAGGGSSVDTTGTNYIKITAKGLADYFANPSVIPSYIGAAGNDLTFRVVDGPATSMSFIGGVFTLTYLLGDTLSTVKSVVESFAAANEDNFVMEFAGTGSAVAYIVAGHPVSTYYFSGGVDPLNFAPTSMPDDTEYNATITGAVGGVAGVLPSTIGLVGKTVSFSIGGGDPQQVTFTDAAGTVVENINAVLGAAATASAFSTRNPYTGEVVGDSLRITASDGGLLGTDSTIEITEIDPFVNTRLFSGVSTLTSEVSAFSPVAGIDATRALSMVPGSDFNAHATTVYEKMPVRGLLTVNINGTMPATIISKPLVGGDAWVAGNLAGKAVEISLVKDGGAPATVSFSFAAGGGTDTIAEAVTQLDTAMGAEGVRVALATLGGMSHVVFYLNSASVGSTFSFTIGGAGGASLITWLGVSVQGVTATSMRGSISVGDSGSGSAWEVTEISRYDNMAGYASSITWSAGNRTAYCLDVGTTTGYNARIYSGATAEFAFALAGNTADGAGTKGTAVPYAIRLDGAPTVTVQYKRFWASSTSQVTPPFQGVTFSGSAHAVLPGDALTSGSPRGRVVAVRDWSVGSYTFPGAVVVLSERSVKANEVLSSWYVTAHNLTDVGPVRVSPELVVFPDTQLLAVKHGLNRDAAGLPGGTTAPLYVGYKALRKDVTAAVTDPILLRFNDATEMENAIGPVSVDNPLALAMSLAFLNAPGTAISCLGVSEVTADAPMGTPLALAEAFSFLDRNNVYALAVLDQSLTALTLTEAYCRAHEDKEWAGKRRLGIVSQRIPTERSAIVGVSGNMTMVKETGTTYRFTFTDGSLNVADALNGTVDANGNAIVANVGTVFAPSQGVFLRRSGDPYNYVVTTIVDPSTVLVSLAPGFDDFGGGPGTSGNGDGFYQTSALYLSTFEADGETCSLSVRQAAIDTTSSAGRLQACSTLAEISATIKNKRVLLVMPEDVIINLDGADTRVHGGYATAVIAAQVAALPPQQPLTYLPVVGIVGCSGSNEKFTELEMATAAAGGVYWLIQEPLNGGPVICRHQLTTDTSDAKTSELSIVKALDFYELDLVETLKGRTGRFLIDIPYLESLDKMVQAQIMRNTGDTSKALESVTIRSLSRSEDNPMKVDISLAAVPWYPCGEIAIVITA